MFEKVFLGCFFLREDFLKLVFESAVFPIVEVSCLEFFSNFSKSASNSECVLALIASNSGFALEVREFDFFELINEFAEFVMFCGF